jgi:sugar-specific transcriptional regulator TrmB
VPPKELLDNLEQNFKHHRRKADRTLEALTHPTPDDRIYHLKTVGQVIQRSKAMLKRAQGIVLCDLFPGPFSLLADSLKETAARGVLVACRVYEDAQIPGVITLHRIEPDPALDKWPGQQINIVVDSEEHLLGLLAKDMEKVYEAVWSNSTFLSCMHHNSLASEIKYMNYKPGSEELAAAEEELDSISLLEFHPSGMETLLQRCQSDTPQAPGDGAP